MSLVSQIELASKEISTDSYSMSIGELLTMYKDGELELHPEFQRLFRWTIEQKSRLVESLLLGIPIPSIFVSQTEKGTWEVIDGLQRLSTIFELTGDLRNPDGSERPPLVLNGTKYLPSLDQMQWNADDPSKELPQEAKLRIKRARIDVNIILSKSDLTAKYELFQRLNTGGTEASEQEVRNAILVMTNRDFFIWISELASYENFKKCVPLTDKALDEQFDMELVTRFVILITVPSEELRSINDLGTFLTDKIVEMAKGESPLDTGKLDYAFKRTFDILAACLGENSFKKYDITRQQASGQVLISLFEVIAIGLGYYLKDEHYVVSEDKVKQVHQEVPINPRFMTTAGSGVRASTRIPNTIGLGRELFAP
jgi:hypothetical protein